MLNLEELLEDKSSYSNLEESM